MWDEILPNTEWVKSNIPQVRKYVHTHVFCSSSFHVHDVAVIISAE